MLAWDFLCHFMSSIQGDLHIELTEKTTKDMHGMMVYGKVFQNLMQMIIGCLLACKNLINMTNLEIGNF
jgi:hypothetical protein